MSNYDIQDLMSVSSVQNKYSVQELRNILRKIAITWEDRTQVKSKRSKEEFLLDKEDFKDELLPFHEHQLYKHLPTNIKKTILSCGWIIYNEKTIAIETSIINPVCNYILNEYIPGVKDNTSKILASEIMTDESYHTLLSVEAVAMTKSFRGLNIIVPEFNLIKYMKNMQTNYHNELDKIVVLLGTATVSELFISDYLKLLSSDYTIQPINRLTVDTHRIDELAHAGIFKRLICIIYQCLPIAQQQLFIMILRNATKWFADPELEIWSSILEQLGINYYPQIISECRFINAHKFKIDYSAIDRLVLELISNKQIA